jgi:hypothetical protein
MANSTGKEMTLSKTHSYILGGTERRDYKHRQWDMPFPISGGSHSSSGLEQPHLPVYCQQPAVTKYPAAKDFLQTCLLSASVSGDVPGCAELISLDSFKIGLSMCF